MSEKIKEYIECRIFILGDENVGKKSFVKKILNLPSTGVIRNAEAEEEYDKLCQKINEEIEKDRIKEEQQKALLASINNQKKNSEKDYDKTSRFPSSNTLFKIDEEKSISHKPSNKNLGKLLDKSNQNYIPTSSNNHKPSNRILDPLGSFNQKKYRQPVPEYPAKLYCVNVDKIVIKLFCIPKAERRPLDFIPQDDDEEYGLEKEHNCSFDGIRKDLNEKLKIKDTIISQDKLYGFNTSIFTLFVFLYDLSNFYSFESLILYYSKLSKLYHIEEEENFKACIVGNKIDKKVWMNKEQENIYNDFMKNTQLKKFEVSTKPYFVFDKFFIDFFFENFSKFNISQTETEFQGENKKLLEDKTFIEQFTKLIKNKSSFARGGRRQLVSASFSPGPEYNINLYSFNSIEEIKEVFSNKKSRFNKKIFTNKSGPVLFNERNGKDDKEKIKDKSMQYNVIKGGLYNKPINGFSFGTVKGKLNLLQKRKDLRQKRYIDFQENVDSYNNSPLSRRPLKLSKDEDYFGNALKRKNNLFENGIKERKLKVSKIIALHHENLRKINEEKMHKYQRKLNLQKSASSPNILFNSISSLDELNKERDLRKERYHEVIYSKNRENLNKYNENLSNIRLLSSMRREPEPYLIDIREKILNPQKGRKILEKFKIVEKHQDSPPYNLIKDDFDKIAEKVNNFRPNYPERFPSEEKLKAQKEKENQSFEEYEKKEEEKRKRWLSNRESSERMMKLKVFQNDRKEKKDKHYEIMKEQELKKEAIQEMRREISIQKGYGDPALLRSINYSQIEESSPKYSIKGRYEIHEVRNDDPGNLVLGSNVDMINYIKEAQKNQPLPNYNYIKRKLPSVVFGKAERFPKQKSSYEDGVLLFEDGIFQPNTHQDFLCKEPMDNQSPRSGIISSNQRSPSPVDYKLKSRFDIIVEEGQKKSKIHEKIKKKIKDKAKVEKLKGNSILTLDNI